MARKLLALAMIALIGIVFYGCAAHQPDPNFQPYNFGPAVDSGQVTKKVDNFLVILDSTQSMAIVDEFKGKSRFERGWDVVMNMARTLPDLGYVGAVRVVGATPCILKNKTKLDYGPRLYTYESFKEKMETINYAEGQTPLAEAIYAAITDLAYARGNIAVIVVSDGVNTTGNPLEAAEKLKLAYGDRLCIYTVEIGKIAKGAEMLEKMAELGGCGFTTTEEELACPVAMAKFVEQVFLQ